MVNDAQASSTPSVSSGAARERSMPANVGCTWSKAQSAERSLLAAPGIAFKPELPDQNFKIGLAEKKLRKRNILLMIGSEGELARS